MSLRTSAVTGIKWTGAANISNQLLRVLLGILLARLLSPHEFGLMGMLMVFVGFAKLFSEFGFGSALVQRKDLTEEHRSSVFYVNIVMGLGLTAVFVVSAPWIARFYDEPELVAMTRMVGLIFTIVAFGVVQRALLLRHMRFRAFALVNVLSTVLAGIVGVSMAYRGYGVWSLVGVSLTTSLGTTVAYWFASSWRPQLRYQHAAVKDLWQYSANLMGFTVFNYWTRNLDNLLIGKFIGTSALGFYTRAYGTMLMPLRQVIGSVNDVMFPALSRVQADKPRSASIYLRAVRLIGFVTIPLYAGMFVVAEPFVLGVLGQQWAEVIPILRILCIAGFLQPVGSASGWLFRSQGRTDLMFRWSVVYGVLLFVAFGIGLQWGVLGVAWAYAIRNHLILYPAIQIPASLIDLKFREIMAVVAPSAAMSGAMALAVGAAGATLPAMPMLVLLGIQVSIGILCYVALGWLFSVRAWHETLSFTLEAMGRSRAETTVPTEPP